MEEAAGELRGTGPSGRRALGLARACAAALLVALTFAGVLVLTALPFAWIVGAAKLSEALSLPAVVPLVAVLVGIPVSMMAGLRALLAVSALYDRVRSNAPPPGRVAPVWRRGLTDTPRRDGRRMLEVVMVVAVGVAVVALCAWFVLFSGQSAQL